MTSPPAASSEPSPHPEQMPPTGLHEYAYQWKSAPEGYRTPDLIWSIITVLAVVITTCLSYYHQEVAFQRFPFTGANCVTGSYSPKIDTTRSIFYYALLACWVNIIALMIYQLFTHRRLVKITLWIITPILFFGLGLHFFYISAFDGASYGHCNVGF
ncbi:hypothetical protein KEM60_02934 [Austwickia sp. TVS 96-490-7B]|uniref:hypothetical protein n=1 Tax=Austwickia sp. TVS 96-490-7B TaxID=2830843 RepID=UPI001C577EF0|nr:hypothetical protein [Austwickia sp. TVS 96-490-7B]MBW3086705.1 hypothetical protein [Austwickia sp. TVS 96-490-7B]